MTAARTGGGVMYTAGSLFSGIGGLDLAAHFAGFDIRFHVEIDEFCRKVLSKHAHEYWPNAQQHADVKQVGRHNLENVDVLFGGFPCQDVSVAGERHGLTADTRTGLWFEFARIIGELRPSVVVLENVPGIRSLGGTTVLADLTRLGYDALWFPVRASDAGAPHRRERWFCVAYSTSTGLYAAVCENGGQVQHAGRNGSNERSPSPMDDPEIVRRHDGANGANEGQAAGNEHPPTGAGTRTRKLADTPRKRCKRRGRTWSRWNGFAYQRTAVGNAKRQRRAVRASRETWRPFHNSQWNDTPPKRGWYKQQSRVASASRRPVKPRLGRAAHGLSCGLDGFNRWPAAPGQPQHEWEAPRVATGIPQRTARLKALGNAVVPQVAYPIFQSIRAWLESVALEEAA